MDVAEIIRQSSFSMLEGKIDGRILEALKLLGISKPTRIQAEVLPHMLLQQDVIGAAKTGSGKTLAFLIPVIDNLVKLGFSRKHGTGCIILSPTRELALQTFLVLKKLLVHIDLTHSLIVGGEKKVKDLLTLKKGVNIIVSTPGRLLDHLQNTENFNCNNLKCLVVDEADKLLEAGFQKHITGIIALLPKNRQTVLFSATIDEKVKNLAKLSLRSNPVLVSVNDDKQATVAGLQQGYYICPVEKRMAWLYKMLKKCKKMKVIAFFSSCKSVDFHYEFFRHHCKAPVMSIHGKQSQSRRKETFQSFVEASNGALFCTDVAARGLNIPCVDWIVQYDPPSDPKITIMPKTKRSPPNTPNTSHQVPISHADQEYVNTNPRHRQSGSGSSTMSELSTFKQELKNELKQDIEDMLTSWNITQTNKLTTMFEEQKSMLNKLILEIADLKRDNETFKKTITEVEKSVNFITAQYEDMTKKVSGLEKERTHLFENVSSLDNKIKDIQLNSRNAVAEIRNVPEKDKETHEDLVSIINNIGLTYGQSYSSSDIRDIRRVPGKPGTPKPIIAEFLHVNNKTNFINGVKKYNKNLPIVSKLNTENLGIPGTRTAVYVSEYLPPQTKKLFFRARDFANTHKYDYCWTSNGTIYLRKSSGDKHILVKSEQTLVDLLKIA